MFIKFSFILHFSSSTFYIFYKFYFDFGKKGWEKYNFSKYINSLIQISKINLINKYNYNTNTIEST